MFLNRHTEPYDLIVVDAFTGSYIPFHLMTKEFYQLVRNRLSPHGVAAFNFLPSKDIFESNVRTVSLAFDNKVDLFHSDAPDIGESNVIVVGRLDPSSDAETLQKAAAAQARYKFRFDVSKLVAEQRMPVPKELKGKVLTDDFAAADVLDARGRRYRREK
jgi:spermidine synthase